MISAIVSKVGNRAKTSVLKSDFFFLAHFEEFYRVCEKNIACSPAGINGSSLNK